MSYLGGGWAASESRRFVNRGVIELIEGRMDVRVNAVFESGSQVVLGTEAVLELSGYQFLVEEEASFSGGGVVAINASNASVTFLGSHTLPRWEVRSGTVAGTGTLSFPEGLLWLSGTFAGTGTTRIPAGSTASLPSGNQGLRDGRVLEIGGALSVGASSGPVVTADSATVRILAGGVVEHTGDGTLFSEGSGTRSLAIVNEGTLRKTDGTGTTYIGGGYAASLTRTYMHRGTIEVLTGTIEFRMNTLFEVGGSARVDENAVLRFGAGTHAPVASTLRLRDGSLTGSSSLTLAGPVLGHGSLAGNFVNAGVWRPDSGNRRFVLTGSYTQSSVGRFESELATPPEGEGYGRLAVTGNATLGGVLAVVLDAHAPVVDEVYAVLTYAGRTGDFLEFEGLETAAVRFVPDAEPGRYTLTVTPATGGITVLSWTEASSGPVELRRSGADHPGERQAVRLAGNLPTDLEARVRIEKSTATGQEISIATLPMASAGETALVPGHWLSRLPGPELTRIRLTLLRADGYEVGTPASTVRWVGEGALAEWQRDHFIDRPDPLPGEDAHTALADPDGDGRVNLIEFVEATHPLVPDQGANLRVLEIDPSSGWLTVEWLRRAGAITGPDNAGLAEWDGVMAQVEHAVSLNADWKAAPGELLAVRRMRGDVPQEQIVLRMRTDPGLGTEGYLRVRVMLNQDAGAYGGANPR